MQNITNELALLGFNNFKKIGSTKLESLEKYFSNFKEAFCASSFDLEKAGLKPKLVSEFIIWRKNFDFAELLKKLETENIKFITIKDKDYPYLLKEISYPPYLLYYQGEIKCLNDINKRRLAIVGARKHSAYAEKIINQFTPDIVSNKIEIVSGLAIGIDTLAHNKTLDYSGITIAVLGTGLDIKNIYPQSNIKLAQAIINNGGLLLSEFPLGTGPLRQNFPQRNRIISGLCQATLVVEAEEKSGSLITANYALDQNREVLAIPGNIFSEYSSGTNNLIKSGARVVLKPEDILEIFKIESNNKQLSKQKTEDINLKNEIEKAIYNILKGASEKSEVITSDEIVKITKLDTSVINSTLSILELRGIAKTNEMGYYIN